MKPTTALLTAALLTALPLFAEDKAPVKESAPAADNSPPPLAPTEKDSDRLELMPAKPAAPAAARGAFAHPGDAAAGGKIAPAPGREPDQNALVGDG